MIDRRQALALGAAAMAAPGLARQPRDAFLWGAATAGHQVEGNNVNADIWLLEQMKPTLFTEPSGDACDSLHRWDQDVAIVKALGLNAYRFSVEWSRIEPAEGQFSQAYLDHYARIVASCRAAGLAPVVTFNHFTTPRWFAARGGWEADDAPALFARYCDRVARAMAGGISHALTFNEP
ncbi:MAG: glycoside hydrolase family 1 protein, partial [Sphingomonas sp.]